MPDGRWFTRRFTDHLGLVTNGPVLCGLQQQRFPAAALTARLFVRGTGRRRSPYLQHVVLMAKGFRLNVASVTRTPILSAKASYPAKPWVKGTGLCVPPLRGVTKSPW